MISVRSNNFFYSEQFYFCVFLFLLAFPRFTLTLLARSIMASHYLGPRHSLPLEEFPYPQGSTSRN
jgi:hypothetical protein